MVEVNFDGLCLDCMDASHLKTHSLDDDYWEHDRLRTCDSDCRVTYSQPSWYFLHMGRPEGIKAHNELQK